MAAHTAPVGRGEERLDKKSFNTTYPAVNTGGGSSGSRRGNDDPNSRSNDANDDANDEKKSGNNCYRRSSGGNIKAMISKFNNGNAAAAAGGIASSSSSSVVTTSNDNPATTHHSRRAATFVGEKSSNGSNDGHSSSLIAGRPVVVAPPSPLAAAVAKAGIEDGSSSIPAVATDPSTDAEEIDLPLFVIGHHRGRRQLLAPSSSSSSSSSVMSNNNYNNNNNDNKNNNNNSTNNDNDEEENVDATVTNIHLLPRDIFGRIKFNKVVDKESEEHVCVSSSTATATAAMVKNTTAATTTIDALSPSSSSSSSSNIGSSIAPPNSTTTTTTESSMKENNDTINNSNYIVVDDDVGCSSSNNKNDLSRQEREGGSSKSKKNKHGSSASSTFRWSMFSSSSGGGGKNNNSCSSSKRGTTTTFNEQQYVSEARKYSNYSNINNKESSTIHDVISSASSSLVVVQQKNETNKKNNINGLKKLKLGGGGGGATAQRKSLISSSSPNCTDEGVGNDEESWEEEEEEEEMQSSSSSCTTNSSRSSMLHDNNDNAKVKVDSVTTTTSNPWKALIAASGLVTAGNATANSSSSSPNNTDEMIVEREEESWGEEILNNNSDNAKVVASSVITTTSNPSWTALIAASGLASATAKDDGYLMTVDDDYKNNNDNVVVKLVSSPTTHPSSTENDIATNEEEEDTTADTSTINATLSLINSNPPSPSTDNDNNNDNSNDADEDADANLTSILLLPRDIFGRIKFNVKSKDVNAATVSDVTTAATATFIENVCPVVVDSTITHDIAAVNTATTTVDNRLVVNPFTRKVSSSSSLLPKNATMPPSTQQQTHAARTYQQSKLHIVSRPQSSSSSRSLVSSYNLAGVACPGSVGTNVATSSTAPVLLPSSSLSSSSKQQNMVLPKSYRRRVLEQVASRYYLRDNDVVLQRNVGYVGAMDYGDGIGVNYGNNNTNNSNDYSNYYCNQSWSQGEGGGETGSSCQMPLGLSGTNVDREAVLSFLGVKSKCMNNNSDQQHVSVNKDEEAKTNNLNNIIEANNLICDDIKSNASDRLNNDNVTTSGVNNIDSILEQASDHLSLGKNDLALEAYRNAMQVAFADVIMVKSKLVEVKMKQEYVTSSSDGGSISVDDHLSMLDLTREEELYFELSLLKVASRVADIHNNIGVVLEMNRQYEKAKSSYGDALEVYHNTCKRFEEKGDPDVDRTKKNIERMTLACNSENERKTIHAKARGIAIRLDKEKNSEKRKSLLNEVVATLNVALKLEAETIGLTHPVSASTLVQIGKYHYEMREYDAAVLEIRQAITIYRNALGSNHPHVGKSLLLLANIYERHGLDVSPQGSCKDDSELELYVDALEPLKATLGEVHREIGCLYAKIGYLYGKKGDLNLSLLAYKASLKAYDDPSLHNVTGGAALIDIVTIWVRITENLSGLKSWGEVLVAGRRALFLLRKLKPTIFATQPPNKTVPKNCHGRAITCDTYFTSLFVTLQSLGQAHMSLSNYSLAQDAFKESLQLAWDMALSACQTCAEGEDLIISVTRVIKALKRLGKVYLLEKHYAPALDCFLPSLELLRSSKELEVTLDCASVLGSLGFLYLRLKKYSESSNFLRECLRLYRKHGELR